MLLFPFRLNEIFESSEVLLGNNVIANNANELMKGVQDLEMYKILTMLQFETKLSSLFKDWKPAETFLMEIGLSEESIQSLADADLNIPGVITRLNN